MIAVRWPIVLKRGVNNAKKSSNMSAPSESVYQFGPFCLDGVRRTLYRKGERVPMTARTFDSASSSFSTRCAYPTRGAAATGHQPKALHAVAISLKGDPPAVGRDLVVRLVPALEHPAGRPRLRLR